MMEKKNVTKEKEKQQLILVAYKSPSKLQRTKAMKDPKYFRIIFDMNDMRESFMDPASQKNLSSYTADKLKLARSMNDVCMEITLMCHNIENAYCFGDMNKSVELAERAWQRFSLLKRATSFPDLPFLLAKLATYSAQAYIARKQFGKAEQYLELAQVTLSETETCDDSMWTLFTIGQYYRDFLFSSPDVLPSVREKAIKSYEKSFRHYQELDPEGRKALYPEAIDCLLNIARIHLDSPDLPFGRSRTGVVTKQDVEDASKALKRADKMLMSQAPKSRRFRQLIRLQLCQGGLYYRKAEFKLAEVSSQCPNAPDKGNEAQSMIQLAKIHVRDVKHQTRSTPFSEKKRSEDFLTYLECHPAFVKAPHRSDVCSSSSHATATDKHTTDTDSDVSTCSIEKQPEYSSAESDVY